MVLQSSEIHQAPVIRRSRVGDPPGIDAAVAGSTPCRTVSDPEHPTRAGALRGQPDPVRSVIGLGEPVSFLLGHDRDCRFGRHLRAMVGSVAYGDSRCSGCALPRGEA